MKKNTFKKIVSTTTALALALGMTVSAFAGEAPTTTTHQIDGRTKDDTKVPASGNTYVGFDTTNKKGVSEGTVKVSTTGADDTTKVYRIDVIWESLEFTYEFVNASTWDPDYHTYGTNADGAWKDSRNSATITVNNHSNDKIKVTSAFGTGDTASKSATTNAVTATLSDDSTTALDTAVGTDFDKAPSEKITVTLSGKPNTSADITVGTITVTVAVPTN